MKLAHIYSTVVSLFIQKSNLNGSQGTSKPENGSTTLPAESLLLPEKPQVCPKCSLARCYCKIINSSASSGGKNVSEKNSAAGAMPENPAMSSGQILDLSPEGPKENNIDKKSQVENTTEQSSVVKADDNKPVEKPVDKLKITPVKVGKQTLGTPASSRKSSPSISLSNGRSRHRDRNYRSRSRSPTKRSRTPRKKSRSPKRSRSPLKYRQYSRSPRSPARRTYGRRSPSPHRRRRSPSPEYRRRSSRSHDSRYRRSRSRNARCFSKRDRHKRHNSKSPSRSRHNSSRSPSPDKSRHKHNGYKHTYSDRNKTTHHKSKHSESSRKRRSKSPEHESPSKRRKRSSSCGRRDKSSGKNAESRPLINGASDDDSSSYQWVEVTKDKLKHSSKG